MKVIFKWNKRIIFGIFAFLDLLCVAVGMGVPFLNILFGFVIGWYIAKRVVIKNKDTKNTLRKILRYAMITSIFTFIIMLVIWGRCVLLLFDSNSNLQNFGIPLILYSPKASFIGWLVLMIFISPFLQLLTTIFSSYLTLLKHLDRKKATPKRT